MPSTIETYKINSLIIFLVVLIVCIVVFTWACAKVIVPLAGRLKNRVLVEENALDSSQPHSREKEVKDIELEPPPSSDRQGIHPTTEDQM